MSSKENLFNEFFFKLIFRLINLFFNGLIVRNVDLYQIAIGNIHLELFYSTILFLSRESLRRNIPKLSNIYSICHYINLIWLIIPFGFIFIFFSLFLILFIPTNHHEESFRYSSQACFMYGLAAFIELLSEPFYLLLTVTQNHRINISIQFISSLIGFGVQTLLIIKYPDSALFYYGVGYLIYSMLITSLYYLYFLIKNKEDRIRLFVIKSLNDLFVKPLSPFVDDKLVHETFTSFRKGISFRILNQGEKYLLTMFSLISYEEQGIYYLIYLLGSIFPQIIFSTIEQISSNYFQQIKNLNSDRTIKLNALTLLNKLTRLLVIISLLLIVFVIPHSSFIIKIYLGTKFNCVLYLRLYLLNILLNSINILNESFIQLTMTNQQLYDYEYFMLFYSFVYLIICFGFMKLFGLVGLIIVNCLNILGRILINRYYLIRFGSLKSCLFSSDYLFLLIISLMIFYFNQIFIEDSFGQLIFSFAFILIIICLTLIDEKETIHYIYCVYKLNSHQSSNRLEMLEKQK